MAQLATLGYILAALMMLGVLITMHELGHYLVARWCGIEVKEFAVGMGPKILSRKGKKTGTLFSLRVLPLGGFCMYYGEDQEMDDPRAYNNQPVWKRFLSVLAGPGMNFVLALVTAVVFFMAWGVYVPIPAVGSVDDATPASEAGLLPGDRIVSIDGTLIQEPADATALVQASQGQPILMTVERDGQELAISVTPRYFDGERVYRVGISYDSELAPLPFGEAVATSVSYCKEVVVMTYQALTDLIIRGQGADELSGPVGMINIIQRETRAGGLPIYLQLAVLISINLGLMNLLPIPGLDGSRLIFQAVEAVRRKPVNQNVEGMIHFIGVVALLGVMLLFTYKDILRLFQPK